MISSPSLRLRRGLSHATAEHTAIAEIRQQLEQEQPRLVVFFCSNRYDLDRLAGELRRAFDGVPVVGCTAAGQIGEAGYLSCGISAISIAGPVEAHPVAIDLADMERGVSAVARRAENLLGAQPQARPFGLLLVDGLAKKEEQLSSLLYRHLPQVPTVGGSAADDRAFRQTQVYVDGEFRAGRAVFTLFLTPVPFHAFRFHHFVPGEQALVVTDAEPPRRLVREINGEPAAKVYAEAVGAPITALGPELFARHPLVLELGGQHYLRAIDKAHEDGALATYCAIEYGTILSVGRVTDQAEAARAAFRQVRRKIGEPALVIGCDCIQRRIEFENSGLLETMGALLGENRVFGFSTYGEQFDGLHMNQTFTGIAFGHGHGRS